MEYRYLGKTGIQVSELSLGAWVTYGGQVGEDAALACMTAAYEAGVNFFDNAEVYASGNAEIVMGNVLKQTGWKRSDLVISTKIFWGGSGPNDKGLSFKHIIEGTNASLARLQMDYVDLIFCHRPDHATPIEETVRAMDAVIKQGKAFYWGTSEWDAADIMLAYAIARREHLTPPILEQPEYNLFRRDKIEKEFLRLYDEIGLGTTTWSPLASGLLTGKYNEVIPEDSRANLAGYEWLRDRFEREETKGKIEKVIKLAEIARSLDCTTAQLAIAWCLTNTNVSSVITGASRPSQVVENMKAMDVKGKLTPELLASIDEIFKTKPDPPALFR